MQTLATAWSHHQSPLGWQDTGEKWYHQSLGTKITQQKTESRPGCSKGPGVPRRGAAALGRCHPRRQGKKTAVLTSASHWISHLEDNWPCILREPAFRSQAFLPSSGAGAWQGHSIGPTDTGKNKKRYRTLSSQRKTKAQVLAQLKRVLQSKVEYF